MIVAVDRYLCGCIEHIDSDGKNEWTKQCPTHAKHGKLSYKEINAIALSSGICSVTSKLMTEPNSTINTGLANTRRHVQKITKIGKNGQQALDLFTEKSI